MTLLILFTHAALLGIPLLVAGILFTFGAYWSPQRTAKGTAVLRHTEGFRRFINESEKERARFAERKNLFSEYLPYAIVFGATGKWAAAFAGLDDQPPDTSSWYIASTPFTFLAFSSAIDGFTVSTSGTLRRRPIDVGLERILRRRILRRWRRWRGRRQLVAASARLEARPYGPKAGDRRQFLEGDGGQSSELLGAGEVSAIARSGGRRDPGGAGRDRRAQPG
jgi:hypothetical protein